VIHGPIRWVSAFPFGNKDRENIKRKILNIWFSLGKALARKQLHYDLWLLKNNKRAALAKIARFPCLSWLFPQLNGQINSYGKVKWSNCTYPRDHYLEKLIFVKMCVCFFCFKKLSTRCNFIFILFFSTNKQANWLIVSAYIYIKAKKSLGEWVGD